MIRISAQKFLDLFQAAGFDMRQSVSYLVKKREIAAVILIRQIKVIFVSGVAFSQMLHLPSAPHANRETLSEFVQNILINIRLGEVERSFSN